MAQINEIHPYTVRQPNGSVEVVNRKSNRDLTKAEVYAILNPETVVAEAPVIVEAVAEVVVEPVAVEVIAEPVIEPVIEPVVEPVVEAVAEPVVEEPVVEEVVDAEAKSRSHRRGSK